MIGAILAMVLPLVALADEGSLALGDLESYRAALARPAGPDAPAVRFRDLWDHPDRHSGRAVRVEGTLARRFRQDRVGDFPALVEAWIVDRAGDPICLVFPDDPGRSIPDVGAPIRFGGTFLRKIRYRGGDQPRLAPLIVGPASPGAPDREPASMAWPGSAIDWGVGLGGSALILLVLIRRHLDRPIAGPSVVGPDPTFEDGPDAEGDGS